MKKLPIVSGTYYVNESDFIWKCRFRFSNSIEIGRWHFDGGLYYCSGIKLVIHEKE